VKNQLLISTLAVGFLAGLGIAAVRGDFSHPTAAPAAAPVAGSAEEPAADAALPLQSAAPEPPAGDRVFDGGESADALPAPTYDDQTAAHDRAAAHSARSR
jgi:hypothetical protein